MGIVVGVTGVSRAGKSTLCKDIKNWFSPKKVIILHMDDFVYPAEEIPKIRGETDWEVPDSVDYKKLAKSISQHKLEYDLVLVEGILIFNDEMIEALYDRKIFVDIDYETFLERKNRDSRWNEPSWYIEHIWTSYLIYCIKFRPDAFATNGSAGWEKEALMDYIQLPDG